jgi:hypothetical protein
VWPHTFVYMRVPTAGPGVIESRADIPKDRETLGEIATEAIAIGAVTIKAQQFSMRIPAGNF